MALIVALIPPPAAAEMATDCGDCHPVQAADFGRSAMARAAAGKAFLAEWSVSSGARRCLRCHAPRGGNGVVCKDCHGAGSHPYPRLEEPAVCARCHDAPGENTVRSFLSSPAAAAGQRCSHCHAMDEGRFTHDFKGPTRTGFLQGIASIRAFLRSDPTNLAATVRIQHQAGHALPGGTSGRAVWLRVLGLDQTGSVLWERQYRFGWEHKGDGRWLDRTLPAGEPTLVELPLVPASGLRSLRFELIFRFRPGPLDDDDPATVILDSMEIEIPR